MPSRCSWRCWPRPGRDIPRRRPSDWSCRARASSGTMLGLLYVYVGSGTGRTAPAPGCPNRAVVAARTRAPAAPALRRPLQRSLAGGAERPRASGFGRDERCRRGRACRLRHPPPVPCRPSLGRRPQMSDDSEAMWTVVGHEGCDTEPIHQPDAIQAHGWLLAIRRRSGGASPTCRRTWLTACRDPSTPTVLGSTRRGCRACTRTPRRRHAIRGHRRLASQMPWLTCGSGGGHGAPDRDHYILEIERDIPPVAADPTAMIATLLEAPSWQAFSEQTVTGVRTDVRLCAHHGLHVSSRPSR